MKRLALAGMAALIAVTAGLLAAPATAAYAEIPDWIKQNAEWWTDGTIDDATFLGAIEYLANAGVITVAGQCPDVGGMSVGTAAPEWQSGSEPDRISVASEILDSISVHNLRFDQNAYVYGESPILLFEVSEPISISTKLGVFDGDGNTVFSQRVNTDEFGNGRVVFSSPGYYVENERIEAIVLIEGTAQKYTAHATMTGLRADLEMTPDPAQSGQSVDMKFTLSTPTPLPLVLKITDEDHNTLHEERVAINDFGIGSATFLAPEFYQTGRTLNVVTSFAASPEQEQVFGMPVTAQPITIKITTDKETYLHRDLVKIHIKTDPPAPDEVVKISAECMRPWDPIKNDSRYGGTWQIELDSEGRATADGYAGHPHDARNDCHRDQRDMVFTTNTPGFVADSPLIKLR